MGQDVGSYFLPRRRVREAVRRVYSVDRDQRLQTMGTRSGTAKLANLTDADARVFLPPDVEVRIADDELSENIRHR